MTPSLRFAGVGALGGLMMALAVILLFKSERAPDPVAGPEPEVRADPLGPELARCRVEVTPGRDCLRVWDLHRRRFLGEISPSTSNADADLASPEPVDGVSNAAPANAVEGG